MAFLKRNPNEIEYPDGKKPLISVIKNDGPGGIILWKHMYEDFNTGSQLIVAESEDALFYKDGVIEGIFSGGKYTLSTENYPFLSRLRNQISGGISAFHCKIYFVNKIHHLEQLWGTDSPIQVRDPIYKLQTSVLARGSYSIQISDSKKFFNKFVGNNIQYTTPEGLTKRFKSAFLQQIKSEIARCILDSNEEIIGIVMEQEKIADSLKPKLSDVMDEYGIRLVNFYISSIMIPEDDPYRKILETERAQGQGQKMVYDDQKETWKDIQSVNIMKDLANNPGAGGVAGAGAGIGMGIGAGYAIGNMAQQTFASIPNATQQSADDRSLKCPSCGISNDVCAKFCNGCGTKMLQENIKCGSCGAESKAGTKFCNECGNKLVS